MALVPWESYNDIPKQSIFIMDKAASTDTTKHRYRVIAADNLSTVRQFALTPDGDGKMNTVHITLLCLTSGTRADGIFKTPNRGLKGLVVPS
jgi:hypothetical protein